jgi:hypothetical protein
MSDDEKLAERIARAMHGDDTWRSWPEKFRRVEIQSWTGKIEKIRRAGLELVEREDGR